MAAAHETTQTAHEAFDSNTTVEGKGRRRAGVSDAGTRSIVTNGVYDRGYGCHEEVQENSSVKGEPAKLSWNLRNMK